MSFVGFTCCRVFSYVLAVAAIIVAWWYYPAEINTAFKICKGIGVGLARVIAFVFNADSIVAETLVTQRLHPERTLLVGAIAAFIFALLMACIRNGFVRHVRNVLILIAVIHLGLAIAWIAYTQQTSIWYTAHENMLRNWFHFMGWNHAETIALEFFSLQSIVVLGEVVFAATLVTALFRRTARP